MGRKVVKPEALAKKSSVPKGKKGEKRKGKQLAIIPVEIDRKTKWKQVQEENSETKSENFSSLNNQGKSYNPKNVRVEGRVISVKAGTDLEK